jgi:hypothetical protein
VEDTLPESDAEPQGVGVIEGVYEYVPVPDRLAVVVADTVIGAEAVEDAHMLKLDVPLTLGDDVGELERVKAAVPVMDAVALTLSVPDAEGQLLGEPEAVPEKMRLEVAEGVGVAGPERVAGSTVADTQPEGVLLSVSVCVAVPLRLAAAEEVTDAEPVSLPDRVPVPQGVAESLLVMVPDAEWEADTEPVPEMEGVMERVAEREAEPVFVIEGDPESEPEGHSVVDLDRDGDMVKERVPVGHAVDVADTVAEGVKAALPLKAALTVPEKVTAAEAVEDGVPE